MLTSIGEFIISLRRGYLTVAFNGFFFWASGEGARRWRITGGGTYMTLLIESVCVVAAVD